MRNSPWVSRAVHELVVQRAADLANDVAELRYKRDESERRWANELSASMARHGECLAALARAEARAQQLQATVDEAWAAHRRQEEFVHRGMEQVNYLVTEMANLKREGFSRHEAKDAEAANAETAADMTAREMDLRKIQSTITEFVAQGDPSYRDIFRFAVAELDRGTPCDRVLQIIRMGYRDNAADDIEEVIPEEEPEAVQPEQEAVA